jgi:outer membrane protein OmpA-like peptidoglycan-associated protein
MRRPVLIALAISCLIGSGTADAQIWPLRRYGSAPAKGAAAIPVNPQASLIATAGTDTIYFARRGITLDPRMMPTLSAEARWLIANPTMTARIEGYADQQDTRSYAVAIGEERAAAVRDFLVLHGVAPDRLKVVSWGKEHPGAVPLATAAPVGARVVTVVSDSGGPPLLGRR